MLTYYVIHTMFTNDGVHFLITINLIWNSSKQTSAIFSHPFNDETSFSHFLFKPPFFLLPFFFCNGNIRRPSRSILIPTIVATSWFIFTAVWWWWFWPRGWRVSIGWRWWCGDTEGHSTSAWNSRAWWISFIPISVLGSYSSGINSVKISYVLDSYNKFIAPVRADSHSSFGLAGTTF